MAESEYVTYDRYRADMADFRRDWTEFRAEMRAEFAAMRRELTTELAGMRVDMAQMEVRVTRWVPIAAGIGGLLGGLVAAAAKIFG